MRGFWLAPLLLTVGTAGAVPVSGPLEAVEEVPIRPKVAGIVMSVKARLHERVSEGQILAVLDTTDMAAAAEQSKAKAGLAGAEAGRAGADAGLLKTQAERARQLQRMGAETRSNLGDAEDLSLLASERREAANEKSQRSQVEEIATAGRLRRARIKSPVDGWVTAVNLSEGERVSGQLSQEPFFVVATDLSELRLSATLPQSAAAGLGVDQPVRFAVASQEGASFPGHAAQIQALPRQEGSKPFYRVELRVGNPGGLLWPGDQATVSWGAPAKGAELAAGEPDPSALSKAFGERDLAVVVGVERYPDLPASDYSRSDAEAVKRFLLAMGMREGNIQTLLDERASFAGIRKVVETWLPNRAAAGGRVFFYYSGHGAPDPASGDAYLVPADGDPNYLKSTAYPLAQLYAKLGELPASEVMVVLDSCFSGAGGRSLLAKGARPLVLAAPKAALGPNTAVLTATGAGQISTSSPEKRHGLLTYHFLKALQDGQDSLGAAYAAAAAAVRDEARALNAEQEPQLLPGPEAVKSRFLFHAPR
ncbi:MAG: efflux RND transporter periplasmic adaptor subunit [Elusimicrobia bacterium]|nr:efflux RND transporter periplasmic adaptor subunit [Elusimicrobiota bacterium]